MKISKILQSPELVLFFVLIFIMFTTPLVVDVLLCIKFDYDLNTIEQKQIETTSYLYAYSKAMLLELLVMVLLVNSWKRTSIAFTLSTGVVSLYFYNQFNFVEGIAKHSIEFIYSFIFPTVTAVCSHVYIQRKEQEQEDKNKIIESNMIRKQSKQLEEKDQIIFNYSEAIEQDQKTIEQITKELHEKTEAFELVQAFEAQQRKKNVQQKRIIEQQQSKIKSIKNESDILRVDAKKYKEVSICPYCKKSFDPSGLNRHKSVCAMNPKNIKEKAKN